LLESRFKFFNLSKNRTNKLEAKMRLSIFFFVLGSSLLVNGDHLHEVSILTGNDGMAAFFGQLSVKICSKNAPVPSICCVAAHIGGDHKFKENRLEVFGGDDLKECYNFDMGTVNSVDDISMTLYHSLTDGGTFDYTEIAVGDDSIYRCYFYNRLDGDDLEVGKDCEKIN